MESNTSIEDRIRMHESCIAECERDLQRLEAEHIDRWKFKVFLRLMLFLAVVAYLMYWGTKHNWWAA
jgi:hypothetical protein